MSHRIDLDELLDQYVEDMPATERDHFEAALYCWRDEAVTDALREPVHPPVVQTPERPGEATD